MRKPTLKLRFTAHDRECFDARGRRYRVRVNTGMGVVTVESGVSVEEIEWRKEWGRFNPTSDDVAAIAIEEFIARQERRQPINRLNAELLHPVVNGQKYTRNHTAAAVCRSHDHQLPKGDRS